MSGVKVADLFGLLGFKLDKSSSKEANAAIEGMRSVLGEVAKLAAGALAGFSLGSAIKSGIAFNATMEDTRTQIAGMLALAKHTDLADQLADADGLMASLQERAKRLPGSLTDYTKVLGMIAQPITDAGIGLKDLEDITVGAAVAAKSMNIDLEAAARDVNQAVMGQFHSVDQLTGRILGSLGYVGEAGRKRFNDLSKAQRAAVLKQALTQKQLAQLADAQSKNASGRWDTLKASIQETLGRVAQPLFRRLSEWLKIANEWLDQNADEVQRWADAIGDGLGVAFDVLVETGRVLAPIVQDIVDAVRAFVRGLQDGEPWAVALAGAIGLWLLPAVVGLLANLALLPFRLAASSFAAWKSRVGALADAFVGATRRAGEFGAAARDALAAGQGRAGAQGLAAGAGAAAKTGRFAAATSVLGPLSLAFAGDELLGALTGGKAGGYGNIGLRIPRDNKIAEALKSLPPSVVPRQAPSTSAGASTTTISNTFQINGATDPNAVATVVDERLQRVLTDAYDTRRGGRR